MEKKNISKSYVKPITNCIKVTPCSIICTSGTEGYNEKKGEEEWTFSKSSDDE